MEQPSSAWRTQTYKELKEQNEPAQVVEKGLPGWQEEESHGPVLHITQGERKSKEKASNVIYGCKTIF